MVDRYLKIVEGNDNVATALRDIEADETVEVGVDDETKVINVKEDVRFGHKIAIEDISEGETVYKYGVSIGYASTPIEAGEWVHVHNVDSNYGRGDLTESESAEAVTQ